MTKPSDDALGSSGMVEHPVALVTRPGVRDNYRLSSVYGSRLPDFARPRLTM